MGPNGDALGRVGSGRGSEDEVEGVLGVDGKTRYLCAVHGQGPGDRARLLVVTVEREADQVGGGKDNGIPLEDDRSLGGIPAS